MQHLLNCLLFLVQRALIIRVDLSLLLCIVKHSKLDQRQMVMVNIKWEGSYKIKISNYGPTLFASKRAHAKGFSQCLWTFNGQIVEVGASNIFFVFKGKDGVK